MKIRIAKAEDANSLIAFNQAMALETEGKRLDAPTLKSGVEAVFRDDRKGFYVVAESAAEIVGGLMITFEWSDWRNAWFWWIQSVYVLPKHRGKGVYRELYQFVLDEANATGNVCGLRLYVENENIVAQKTYQKLGMTASRYQMYEVSLK